MSLNNNTIRIDGQSWFIPMDILMIISTAFAVILAVIFLLFIILDKTCHTVPMMLVANSCLAELLFGTDVLGMAIFTLQNDIKQIQFYDSLCIFRGYMIHMTCLIQNYSYVLQAIYRYITVVYPARLFWQSMRFQIILISLTWICGIIYPIPLVFTDNFKYHVDDQICEMPLDLSFITIFNVFYLYLVPMGLIVLIYFKMVRYVRQMSKNVTPVNTLFHAQRELKMIQRIVSLVFILLALGFPYTIFIIMSFFNSAPKYHFRIAYIFVDVSLALIIIALFEITEPLKKSIIKRINGGPTVVIPIVT
jgi:hypothetical protein